MLIAIAEGIDRRDLEARARRRFRGGPRRGAHDHDSHEVPGADPVADAAA
jgi:hypothetical protein